MLLEVLFCLLAFQAAGVEATGRVDASRIKQGEPVCVEWTLANASKALRVLEFSSFLRVEKLRGDEWAAARSLMSAGLPQIEGESPPQLRLEPQAKSTVGHLVWTARLFEVGEYRLCRAIRVSRGQWVKLPWVRVSVTADKSQVALWKEHARTLRRVVEPGLIAPSRRYAFRRARGLNASIEARGLDRLLTEVRLLNKLLRLKWAPRVKAALQLSLASKRLLLAAREPAPEFGHLRHARAALTNIAKVGQGGLRTGFRARKEIADFLIACQARDFDRATQLGKKLLAVHAAGDGSRVWAQGLRNLLGVVEKIR